MEEEDNNSRFTFRDKKVVLHDKGTTRDMVLLLIKYFRILFFNGEELDMQVDLKFCFSSSSFHTVAAIPCP